jgi:hypothetical protein
MCRVEADFDQGFKDRVRMFRTFLRFQPARLQSVPLIVEKSSEDFLKETAICSRIPIDRKVRVSMSDLLKMKSVGLPMSLALCLWIRNAFGGSAAEGDFEFNATEQFILRQVAAGQPADLGKAHMAREIHGRFLQLLLTSTNCSSPRQAIHIRKAVVVDPVDLAAAEVGCAVALEEMAFYEAVDLSGSHFARGLSVAGSTFHNSLFVQDAKVDTHLVLSNATFLGETDFSFTSIGGNLWADLSSFAKPARFELVNVGLAASFNNSAFTNDADFYGAKIGDKLLADGAAFYGRAVFESLKVNGTAWFRGASFRNSTSFGYAEIHDAFSIEAAAFDDLTNKANFYGVAVGGQVDLSSCTFCGPVEFGGARIAKDLVANSSTFSNRTQLANFSGMKVEGCCYFHDARFGGPANFILADIGGNFEADRAHFSSQASFADLVSRTDNFLHYNTEFGSMKVAGFLVLADASFAGTVSFRNADLKNLHLEGVDWPSNANSVRLEGLSYRHIRASVPVAASEIDPTHKRSSIDQRDSWNHLQALLERKAAYSADVFEGLESYFLREGEPGLANDVFIERKKQERQMVLQGFAWCWSWFLYLLVAYGRHPEFALAWSSLIIALGSWVFRQENMSPKKHEHRAPPKGKDPGPQLAMDSAPIPAPYSPFWYSLDLFVPLIDLKSSDDWMPMPKRRLTLYTAFHKLSGAILIPMGLAAFTGMVK